MKLYAFSYNTLQPSHLSWVSRRFQATELGLGHIFPLLDLHTGKDEFEASEGNRISINHNKVIALLIMEVRITTEDVNLFPPFLSSADMYVNRPFVPFEESSGVTLRGYINHCL